MDTFETWKVVRLPPGCFQSHPLNTEPSCAQAPRQVLGSLEETQLPLFQAKGEEKGDNTGESGGGGAGDREDRGSFQGERVLLGRAMSHL